MPLLRCGFGGLFCPRLPAPGSGQPAGTGGALFCRADRSALQCLSCWRLRTPADPGRQGVQDRRLHSDRAARARCRRSPWRALSSTPSRILTRRSRSRRRPTSAAITISRLTRSACFWRDESPTMRVPSCRAAMTGSAIPSPWIIPTCASPRRWTLHNSELRVGLSVNNGPTVQDPYNSTFAWIFPFASSALAPTPTAQPLLAGGLIGNSIGATLYAWYDRSLSTGCGFLGAGKFVIRPPRSWVFYRYRRTG